MTQSIPKPRKSHISGTRAYDLQRKWISHIRLIYSEAIHFRLTRDDISDRIVSGVMNTPEWERVAKHIQQYVQGYWEAKRESLFQEHIIWALSVDGKLMLNKEVDLLTEEESLNPVLFLSPGYRSPWARVDSDMSRHVWKGMNGKPLFNKPFDRRFVKADY